MFARWQRRFMTGWAFGGEALEFIKTHPKLLVFPVLSGSVYVALLLSILILPIHSIVLANAGLWGTLALWFSLYLAVWFIAVFFNTALCGTVLMFHATGEMSLGDGIAVAVRRAPQILAWSAFAATIGVLLSMLSAFLEQQLSWVGEIFGFALEATWATAVYFVAPVLAADGVGPFTAMSRSAGLIKSQWGGAVGSEVALTWRLWPLHLVGLAMTLILVYVVPDRSSQPVSAIQLWLAAGVFAYILVSSALHRLMSGIVSSNLYLFAAFGEMPASADRDAYLAAFRRRK